jgi:hypothetical protein
MKELTKKELDRQDFVDNSIFKLIEELNLSEKNVNWDIEMIGEVRDVISDWLVDRLELCDDYEYYPYLDVDEKRDF